MYGKDNLNHNFNAWKYILSTATKQFWILIYGISRHFPKGYPRKNIFKDYMLSFCNPWKTHKICEAIVVFFRLTFDRKKHQKWTLLQSCVAFSTFYDWVKWVFVEIIDFFFIFIQSFDSVWYQTVSKTIAYEFPQISNIPIDVQCTFRVFLLWG